MKKRKCLSLREIPHTRRCTSPGANGIWWEQYVPFDGRLLWYYTQATNVSRYFHVNALGSLGLANDQTGAPVEEMLYYPFGVRWQNTTGFGWDEKFARFPQRDEDLQKYMASFREYYPGLGRWMTPDPIGGDVTNPQSLNRYAYTLNNPTTLTDPLGLWNFGDCLDDPLDPDCGPPPCYFGDWNDCPPCDPVFGCGYPSGGGGGSGGNGGGGAPAPPSAPPAGQPPLRGGGVAGNRWVSPATPWPCLGSITATPVWSGANEAPCFVIIVQTSALSFPETPFAYVGQVIVGRQTGPILTRQSKPVEWPRTADKGWEKAVMTGSCAEGPELWPPLKGVDETHPDPGVDAERSVPGPRDPQVEGVLGGIQILGNAARCTTEGRIP